ncbi:unnamed protein product [Peniophora sp. CBMAI 1063]|nr:unnamed protein product [Peniophora sp. CBMAI 1063]
MIGLSFVLLAMAASLTAATPAPTARWVDMQVKHAWKRAPAKWSSRGLPEDGTTIDLRIKLKSHDSDAIIKALYEVSDPKSTSYGAHLNKDEVASLVAPHPDTHAIVSEWLAHHAIPADTVRPALHGDWLMLESVPISTANTLLGASYEIYENMETGDSIIRTTSYSLPADLHEHIALVSPTTFFGGMRPMKTTYHLEPSAPVLKEDSTFRAEVLATGAVPSSCASSITPACLQALYNTTGYTPQATDVNVLGVAGYLDEYANFADLTTFAQKFLTNASDATFTVVQINGGGNDQSDPGVEANLDIQYTTAVSYPTPQIYYSTGGSPPFNASEGTPTNTNEPYLDFLDYLLSADTIPQTLTTSYGDEEQTVPEDYAVEVCNLFAQLGSMGTSVLFSSGDSGVGGDCVSNDGSETEMFIPAFPASCPYVTAVGGTEGINPEKAVDFSGGGFSNYFATPGYQADVVSSYVDGLGSEYAGLYNKTGRGYPDVAAQGVNFQVVIGGQTGGVSGTSASSPAFAGVVSLLNDYRLSQGKSSLGFLNPMLYTTGVPGFNDITSGSNPGCSTDGFSTATGWDPVTGLGTPNFGLLQEIVG